MPGVTTSTMASSDLNPTTDTKTPNSCSFIKVKHGENNEDIFNPCCPNGVLLACIRKKCKCEANVVVDLIDLQGHVRNLSDKLTDYASGLLDSRQTYILIKVEKQEGERPPQYISLLKDVDQTHPGIQEKLTSLSQAPEKPTAANKKSKWNTMKTKISVTRSIMSMSREKTSTSRSSRGSNS